MSKAHHRQAALFVLALCLGSRVSLGEEFTAQQFDFFERRVRPLLIESCQDCHGAEQAEGGLRLDRRTAILRGGDRGAGIVPGKPSRSLLLRAVSYSDENLAMPPDGKLRPEQIDDLQEWIRMQAPWPQEVAPESGGDTVADPLKHWAFQRIQKPALPSVRDKNWIKNEVDRFVLAKLEQAGLSPSPRASDRTLVRRAYLDLTGLPPSYENVVEFSRSENTIGEEATSGKFEQLIERLLASRAYGERWGRHWLDVARYADTKGYVDGGQARYAFAYTYRDYVIRAFNDDLPYDEFVLDQLAADLRDYDSTSRWRLAAMGFLTVGRRFNHNYHDTLDDQIDVISRGLQGLTVSCARCHDHKFDPISTADYYSLYGILANAEEPQHSELPIVGEGGAEGDSPEHLQELKKRAAEYDSKFAELHQTIQHELRAFAGDYLRYVVRESDKHRDGPQNSLKTDRTILRGPSAYGYGAIRRWRTYLQTRSDDDDVFGPWHAVDVADKADFAAVLAEHIERPHVNVRLREKLLADQPQSMIELATAYGELLEAIYNKWQGLSEANPQLAALTDSAEEQLRQALYADDSPAVMTRFDSIDCYHLDEHTNMRNLAGKVEEHSLQAEHPAPRAMVLRQRNVHYQPVIFRRGRPDRRGEKVPLQIPAAFSSIDTTTASSARPPDDDRLALAQSIVASSNPLTARVIVNRVWAWHLGKPLVSTVSDFGVRSDSPSHPALLDYLANWFVDNGWSMKKLHRLIMTSNTYQQASIARAECVSVDPENRLLWRFNPRRLEWEAIRDSLLSVSGRLQSSHTGGKPVNQSPDSPGSVCRTVYLHIDRQEIPRFARNFDFPAPDFTSPQRPMTTVPQQQLFFLNSPFVWKQAETLAERLTASESNDLARFRKLHRRVFARETELTDDQIRQALRELRNALAEDEAQNLWSVVAHAMLQSNEFILLE